MPHWKEALNTVHKCVRARVEHTFAHMKSWNILRNCRRKRDGVKHATRDIALMRNLAITAYPAAPPPSPIPTNALDHYGTTFRRGDID